jgi:hypothetical protein
LHQSSSHMIQMVEMTYIRKYFLTLLQILFYILQIRVTEIPRNKCNFNKQFQTQLKTRYPHIFVIYTLILLYLREGLIACRLHKCRFCTSQFSETTSKLVVIDIFVAADLKRYFAVHSQVYDCSQMY